MKTVSKKISPFLPHLGLISLFQALGCWGRAKTSKKKNEGGLRRGAAGEPVRLSLTTLFWYSRSCYTLWLVNFDSTVNTPAVTSYFVNPSLPSCNSILQELDSQVCGLKIDQSEGIVAPAIPEEGR